MSFKVVKNEAGDVVAFGPNEDWYEPNNGVYEVQDDEPVITPPPPTPLQEITALEQSKPITHRMLRDLSMTVAQIAAAVTGTDMMTNPAVREIATMNAQIDALREEAKVQGLIP